MRVAVLDLETDPFKHGRVPQAFASGFYDGQKFVCFWGLDCVARLVAVLKKIEEPLCIYAHNGGRFDVFYFLKYMAADMRIINGRIISSHLFHHEMRDSYAILPFPLKDFEKDEIDYRKLEANVRDLHRDEIIKYLKKDCTSLYTLVAAFREEFGDSLTIGTSALKELKKRHSFKCGGPYFDAKFRKDFYFGGRVQVFKAGITKMPVKVYDVNSMYPDVMHRCLHPVDAMPKLDKHIGASTCFVVAEGRNYGAFAHREENGSLSFTKEYGRFCTTIHEWNAAEETKTFKPYKIIKTYGFDTRITFDEFVSHFYGERRLAKFRGDKIHSLFYKYVLNSAYGKFAQNPENFKEYQITTIDMNPGEPWEIAYIHDEYVIWEKPTERKKYYNIATGASITGAARAVLLRGLHAAVDPLYCDTDSIICRSLRGVSLGDDNLGDWKLEVQGTLAAIAGKKLYAIWDQTLWDQGKETCIKKAHKGARLEAHQIYKIAQGEVVHYQKDSPTFSLGITSDQKGRGRIYIQAKFIERNIQRTAV